jgi:hypothetical protein
MPMKNEASALAGLKRIVERQEGEDGTTHLQGFSQSCSTNCSGNAHASGTRNTRRHVDAGPESHEGQLC